MLRAGIIGCGRIASSFSNTSRRGYSRTHMGAYQGAKDIEVIAVCDINKKNLKECLNKWDIQRGYLNYKEMLEKEKIDIVSICTPVESHYFLIKEVTKNKHIRAIFCEKPISDNIRDANKIIELCQKRNILLMVNHQRRFAPFYQELKQNISSGKLGKIQQVNCYYTRGIFNTGTHILDLFCFLFGEPEWITAIYSQNKFPFKEDPNLDVVIKFKKDLLITVKACNDAYYLIFEIDILTSKARMQLGAEFEYSQISPGKNLLGKNQLIKIKNPPFKSKYKSISLTYGVKHIINCLRGKEKPLSSGNDAIKALKLIKAGISSAENKGKRIYLD